jgi:hypothetical protein
VSLSLSQVFFAFFVAYGLPAQELPERSNFAAASIGSALLVMSTAALKAL